MHLGKIDNTPSHRKYIWLFFLIAIGFCVFIFDYTLSCVTIKIYPQNVQQTFKTTISLDQKASTADYDKLIFPVKVADKEVQVEAEIEATGVKTEEGYAHGEIVIESKRDKDISLPKGHKVIKGEGPVAGEAYKDKIVFALDKDITIPAGETITTTVTAVNKGARGDIQSGPLYFASMAQWNRERILPRSVEPFTGGIRNSKVITSEDIDVAKETLLKKAKKETYQFFASQLSSDKDCLEDMSYVHIQEFSTAKPIGEVTDFFQSTLKGQAKILIFSKSEIKESLKKKLSKEYANSDIVSIDENSFALVLKELGADQSKASLEASLSGTFAPKFSSDIFEKNDLVGFNETAIRQKYSHNPAIEKVEARFFPVWRKTVPSLQEHVFIEIAH